MPKSLYDYCIEREEFQILAQWDKDKNEELTPRDVSYGSHKKVWWRCERGHQWEARAYNRVLGTGCPVCANDHLSVGENDFATTHPEFAAQWHPTKNETLTPQMVTTYSNKNVWWICSKGHEWQARVYTRSSQKSGCPVCAGKQVVAGGNDLASSFPEVAVQWHPTKNGTLTPQMVTSNSNKKVWWVCEKGHEWQATIASRTKGAGCPVCTNRQVSVGENDLATTHPYLAAQWHTQKNGTLTPEQVTYGSNKKVWWICDKGHEWCAPISRRSIYLCNCPICAGKQIVVGENDLASSFPEIAAQWHPTKNGVLTPQMVTTHSGKKAWWICELGHEYVTQICKRTSNASGCPCCTGKKVLEGFNDLATKEPQIAAQWDTELNGTFTPKQVTKNSGKKVWWKCTYGHVWKAVIASRTGKYKTGCPVCAGRKKKTCNDEIEF